MQNTPDFPSLKELQTKTAAFDNIKTEEYHYQKNKIIKEMNIAAEFGKKYLKFSLLTLLPDLFYVFAAELTELGYSVEFCLEDAILTIKW